MSPFHAGEAALQAAMGMRERMEGVGARVIRAAMPDQHRELFEKLPTMLVGTLDEGQPWATMIQGPRGFVQTPDDRTLRLGAYPGADDPALSGIRPGAPVALLGLEPETRRRNRANGEVVATEAGAWTVRVHQSFGNCPKYIHPRRPAARPERAAEPRRAEGPSLSEEARALIERSDTMFVASSSAGRLAAGDLAAREGAGVDVSHRGGPAGFVTITRQGEGDTLVLPDYDGNWMFNTLGNLLSWPRAGLLFVDYVEGHVLQLAATAEVRVGAASEARSLALRVVRGWLRRWAMPLTWTPTEEALR